MKYTILFGDNNSIMFQDEKSIVDPVIVLEKMRDGNAKVCLNSHIDERNILENKYKVHFHLKQAPELNNWKIVIANNEQDAQEKIVPEIIKNINELSDGARKICNIYGVEVIPNDIIIDRIEESESVYKYFHTQDWFVE